MQDKGELLLHEEGFCKVTLVYPTRVSGRVEGGGTVRSPYPCKPATGSVPVSLETCS